MWVEEDDIRPVLVSDPDIQEAPLRRPDHDGYCTDKIVCGNGVVEEGEQCDDGEEGSELCDEQCNYKPTSGVQGKKFHDLDQNGKYSEGDLWLDGRMITIYTPERELVKTMTTNDDTTEAGKVAVGQYRFVNLYPGTYHVCEGASAGWIQTRPVAGFVDPNTSLYCHTVELAPGELKTGVRFGNFLVEEGDECVETATTVDALTHTTSAPLATNVMLQAGDHLVIDVASDDTWSAGEGDRTSNADGLVAGNLYGGVYGNYGDFPYGALVGQIGDGAYFLIGTSFDGVVSESGELKLMYRDSLYTDNSGEVAVQIDVNCETENECVVPEVGTVGVDQTFGSNYIVCRADEQSARVAHNDV